IGRTKAIDSALNASKKVALPITTRARTNKRDVGTCSMRVIRAAAGSSGEKGGKEMAGASVRDPALTTDKGSLPLFWLYPPALSTCMRRQDNPRAGGWLDQISLTRSISARIFSAINAGHSIGVKWRTFGRIESV